MKTSRIQKRAQSHVEIVISFGLFVGFLIIILLFINPLEKVKDRPIYFDKVGNLIINYISTDVTKVSIFTGGTEKCYEFTRRGLGITDNLRYKEKTYIQNKYDIYFSEIFESDSHTKKGCEPLDYRIATVKTSRMVVIDKISSLERNYKEFKRLHGLEYDFSLEIIGGSKEAGESTGFSKQPPIGINVYAKEMPIIVIDKEANIRQETIRIRVW